eukprot:1982108-Prymnesium_polylepis.1
MRSSPPVLPSWRPHGMQKAPFSTLPLTTLQVRNQPSAPTTQTRHLGDALVQWASSADHLSGAASAREGYIFWSSQSALARGESADSSPSGRRR